MARNTSVSLGDHFTEFIDRQVESGRYNTASDVIRAGLRRLEDDQTRLEALRAAIDEGERSGKPEPLDVDQFLAQMRSERAR